MNPDPQLTKTSTLFQKYENHLQRRDPNASKSNFGKLLIIGGSCGMAGAAFFAGLAAFRCGIGMTAFYGPECNRMILQTLLPEAMYNSCDANTAGDAANAADADNGVAADAIHTSETDELSSVSLEKAVNWADRIICGPGLSTSAQAEKLLRQLLKLDLSDKRLLLFDADALNLIALHGLDLKAVSTPCRKTALENREDFGSRAVLKSHTGLKSNVVITPHVGEMSRLTGLSIQKIKENPAAVAADFAQKNNCTVVLKDAVTYIASPDGSVFQNDSGCSALAKAGSGDVLTGVIAGICAITGADAAESAALGCYIHGRAGEKAAAKLGIHSTLARDIAEAAGWFCDGT